MAWDYATRFFWKRNADHRFNACPAERSGAIQRGRIRLQCRPLVTPRNMPELTAALLTQHLNQLVVRETGRPLGSAGTAIAVEARNGGWHVAVSCGYPLARSADEFRAADAVRVGCFHLAYCLVHGKVEYAGHRAACL